MTVVLLSQEKSNLPVMKNTSSDLLDTTWPTTKPVTIGNSHTDCINHNLSKAVWQAGCKAALIAKDKSCSLSGYLSSQACR